MSQIYHLTGLTIKRGYVNSFGTLEIELSNGTWIELDKDQAKEIAGADRYAEIMAEYRDDSEFRYSSAELRAMSGERL